MSYQTPLEARLDRIDKKLQRLCPVVAKAQTDIVWLDRTIHAILGKLEPKPVEPPVDLPKISGEIDAAVLAAMSNKEAAKVAVESHEHKKKLATLREIRGKLEEILSGCSETPSFEELHENGIRLRILAETGDVDRPAVLLIHHGDSTTMTGITLANLLALAVRAEV